MSYPSFENVIDVQKELHHLRFEYWKGHDLFSLQWWGLLLMFIVPWIIWYKVIPKEKKAEVLSYGLLIGLLSSQLDEIGVMTGTWAYPYQLVQTNRGLNPYNFTLIPVGYMIVYHYFTKWKHFILGNVVIGVIAAFIAEPFLDYTGIYKPINWHYYYSLPIYIVLPIIFRVFVYYFLEKNKT
ncbi:hypothetical protein CIB95_00420 [Lottiidibacillus patelloidae]|uniref:ABC transporter permease n=1 Tax=Lottiidibacillus patelloidae TaxID=2670334 RepID=A0A263BWX6_9BACI|nr:CBO0543 family protein [Lottiidibacillus patelloidae]OZM58078.1 hypothetical protein CIB95_00420 [Lottiidibacillus patelloidae]